MEKVSAGLEAEIDDGGESAAQEHVGKLRVERGSGFPIGHRPLGLGEVDVGVPEAGGDDAMVAGDDGGIGGNGDLSADRRDEAVADQNGAVFDGGIGGRDVDARVFDGQRSPGEFERRMRSVAGIELNEPDCGAGNDKKDQ